MHIKEFVKCERVENGYHVLYSKKIHSIDYVALFFHEASGRIYRFGAMKFIENLKTIYKDGISFEMIGVTMENINNIAYIHETYEYSQKEVTPEINQLIENDATIELCHRKFIGYAVMTQENFYQLLLTWEKLIDNRAPFILLYLDDKNWYDVLPFDSQETMEQFVADHTQQEKV